MSFWLPRPQTVHKKSIDRGQFLRGNWRGVADIMTPPWAAQGDLFFKLCTQCNDCIGACPENILVSGDKGYPQVDFKRGECTFCGDCETACKDKALQSTGQAPWHYVAQINAHCLNKKGVMCRSCADNCDQSAIHFQLAVGGFSSPQIDLEQCTGCGACIVPCPNGSIEITQNHPSLSEN
jgi:ferredoxin-type protein NapF